MKLDRIDVKPPLVHWETILKEWVDLNKEIFNCAHGKFAAYSYREKHRIKLRYDSAKKDAAKLGKLADTTNIALVFIVPRVQDSEKQGFEKSVLELTNHCMAKTIWSRNRIAKRSQHCFKRRVISTSSCDGAGSPDG